MKFVYAVIVMLTTAAGAAALSLSPVDSEVEAQQFVAVERVQIDQLIGLVVAPYKR